MWKHIWTIGSKMYSAGFVRLDNGTWWLQWCLRPTIKIILIRTMWWCQNIYKNTNIYKIYKKIQTHLQWCLWPTILIMNMETWWWNKKLLQKQIISLVVYTCISVKHIHGTGDTVQWVKIKSTIDWKYHIVMIYEAFWPICVSSISDDSFQYKTTWIKFFMIEVNKFNF